MSPCQGLCLSLKYRAGEPSEDKVPRNARECLQSHSSILNGLIHPCNGLHVTNQNFSCESSAPS